MTLKERRMNKMKILVIGTGAIGGLYAAKLSQVGAEVSVVCRSDYEQVKRGGIEIKSLWGDFVFKPHQVLRDVKEFKEKADFILIATKALPEISLPDIIKPVLTPETSIAIIQNGIFIEKDLAQAFPNHHLLSIIAFIAVKKEQPALVEHDDNGKLIIGEKQNPNPQKTQELFDLWQKSGVPCVLSDNIQLDRWKKLLWNASFNPISVLAGELNTKEMLDDPEIKFWIRDAMLEVQLLAKADGYEISDDFIEDTIDATAARKNPALTSMLLDFKAGRKMELEAILGNALKFAAEKNVDLPLMQDHYRSLSNY